MTTEAHHRHPLRIGESALAANESSHLLRQHISMDEDELDEESDSEYPYFNQVRRAIESIVFSPARLLPKLLIIIFMSFLVLSPFYFARRVEKIRTINEAQEDYFDIPPKLSLWYRTWGNPHGIPLLFVHGGPGNAVEDYHNGNARFFSSERFFVVEVDQRGTGKSTPSIRDSASNMKYYEDISIQKMADDFDHLRMHLNIHKWVVWGGSYGSTLSLVYGERYPDSCLALLLRGIYLETEHEVHEVYSRSSYLNNTHRLHEFDTLLQYAQEYVHRQREDPIDPEDAHRLMQVYADMITDGDKLASWHWWVFENNLMEEDPENLRDPHHIYDPDLGQALSVSFLETRLWLRGTYEHPTNLVQHLAPIREIPMWICQGELDEVCPPHNARDLVVELQSLGTKQLVSRFVNSGHEDTDPVMEQCLLQNIRDFSAWFEGAYRDHQ